MVINGIVIVLVVFMMGYAMLQGCSVNINVTLKHELVQSATEPAHVEEPEQDDLDRSIDEVIKSINSIMLDEEVTDEG